MGLGELGSVFLSWPCADQSLLCRVSFVLCMHCQETTLVVFRVFGKVGVVLVPQGVLAHILHHSLNKSISSKLSAHDSA